MKFMNVRAVLALAALATAVTAFADVKADQLLKRHAEKLSAMKSLTADLTVTSGESSYKITMQLQKPNKLRLVSTDVERVSDGETVWTYSPSKNEFLKIKGAGDPANAMRVDELYIWLPFFKADALSKVDNASYVGQERIKTKMFDVVQVTLPNGKVLKIDIDPDTGVGRHADVSAPKAANILITSRNFTPDSVLDEKTFSFNPPKDAKEVTEADLHPMWLSDMSKALAMAKSSRKIVLLDFYADWCHFCKKLDAEVYTAPEFTALASSKFVLLKINGDNYPQIAQQYGVDGYPTIVFLNGEGKVVHKLVGYVPLQQFLAEMRTAIANAGM